MNFFDNKIETIIMQLKLHYNGYKKNFSRDLLMDLRGTC